MAMEDARGDRDKNEAGWMEMDGDGKGNGKGRWRCTSTSPCKPEGEMVTANLRDVH
jgi:hypothetical protein